VLLYCAFRAYLLPVKAVIALEVPLMIFCLSFGLSMDYELFLLFRIQREYLEHGDNDRGLELVPGPPSDRRRPQKFRRRSSPIKDSPPSDISRS